MPAQKSEAHCSTPKSDMSTPLRAQLFSPKDSDPETLQTSNRASFGPRGCRRKRRTGPWPQPLLRTSSQLELPGWGDARYDLLCAKSEWSKSVWPSWLSFINLVTALGSADSLKLREESQPSRTSEYLLRKRWDGGSRTGHEPRKQRNPGTRTDEEQGTHDGIPPALAHHLVLQVGLGSGQNLLESPSQGLGKGERKARTSLEAELYWRPPTPLHHSSSSSRLIDSKRSEVP